MEINQEPLLTKKGGEPNIGSKLNHRHRDKE